MADRWSERIFGEDSGFSRLMNLLFDILYVGILWLLGCIPIITAGASTTAAYYAMAKCVRHKTGYIGREYLHGFRENFRQMLTLTLLFLAVCAVLAIDIVYVWQQEGSFFSALFVILTFVSFLTAGMAIYACPLLSRFHKRNTELLRTALYVLFRFLPFTVLLLVLSAAACLGVYLMPWAVFVIPGLYLYGLSFPMERVLRHLTPPVDEESEEGQKWYYQ